MDHCCSRHQILICLFHPEDVQQMLLMASPQVQHYFLKLTLSWIKFPQEQTIQTWGPSILILQLPSFLYFLWIKNNIVLFTLTCYNMCIHNCRTHELLQDVLFHWSELLLLQILHQGGRKEERLQSAHTLKLKELLLNGVKMFVPMSYGQTTLSHALRPEPVLNIPETCWFVWIVNGKADSSNVFQGLEEKRKNKVTPNILLKPKV